MIDDVIRSAGAEIYSAQRMFVDICNACNVAGCFLKFFLLMIPLLPAIFFHYNLTDAALFMELVPRKDMGLVFLAFHCEGRRR